MEGVTYGHVEGRSGREIANSETEDCAARRHEVATGCCDELQYHADNDGHSADHKDTLASEVVIQGCGRKGSHELADVDHGRHDGERARRDLPLAIIVPFAKVFEEDVCHRSAARRTS